MRKKILLGLCALFMLGITTFAQTTATGKVVDEKGAAISGATVIEKGTKNGTTTASDGSYSLKVKSGAKITVSSVGYEANSIQAGSGVRVALKNSSENINEVVVTALGISKSREKIGYSATTFKSEDINRASAVSPLDGLQGRVAGADISTIGGQPGSSSKVVLRGYGSITGSNQALIVVDGVPFNNSRLGSTNEALDFGNGLNDLNPNDIESINILKGAAASSLYGSQASNGVIMITMKKGKSGRIKVDFNSSAILSSVGKLPTFQNTFGQGWGGKHWKEENGSWGPRLDGAIRLWGSEVDNSRLLKPFSAVESNVKDFYETGYELNNNVSIKGGNENTNFYFNYGNVKSDGILPGANDKYSRNNFSLRAQTTSDNFTIGASFNYVNKTARTASTDDNDAGSSTFENIIQIARDMNIRDFRDYNNKFFNVDNYFSPYSSNPYFSLNENGNRYSNDRFFGNLDLAYKLSPKFTLRSKLGYDVANSILKDYQAVERPKDGTWRGKNSTNAEGQAYTAKTGGVRDRSDNAAILNTDLFLDYKTKISTDWSFDGFLGFNYNEISSRFQSASVTNLTIPNYYQINNSSNNPVATSGITKKRTYAGFSQLNFSFREYLNISLTGRNDIYSTLPIATRSYFYPGANASWVVNKMPGFKVKEINSLKFRAAYGQTGRDAGVYQLKSILASTSVGLGFGFIDFPINGVGAFELGNQIGSNKLKPEITTEGELGMEAKLFNNKLGIDVTVYEKVTDGQIFPINIANSTGYSTLVSNFGKVKNSGIELALTYTPIKTKNFRWDLNYTYTKNYNQVLTVPGDLQKIDLTSHYDVKMTARAGKPLGLIEAIKPQFTSSGQIIVNSANGLPIPTSDDYIYANINKDFMMGLNTNFTFKNIRVGMTFDYRSGGSFVSRTADLLNFVGNAYNTTYNDRKPFIIPNSVVQNGVDFGGKPVYKENEKAIDMDHFYSYFYHTDNKAMAWQNRILSKSFVKLRDVTLSYSFSQSIAKKIKADNIVLTFIGRNLLIWVPSENLFVDPEATNLGNDLTGEFAEYATSPTSKSYGVSLKIGF